MSLSNFPILTFSFKETTSSSSSEDEDEKNNENKNGKSKDDDDDNDENVETLEMVEKLANKFITNILKPLSNLELLITDTKTPNNNSSRNNYFILIDGIDDLLLLSERLLNITTTTTNINQTNKETKSSILILEFINRVFLFFPNWLNLILTSRRASEKFTLRKYLTNIKYDRLIMDKCVNLTNASSSSVMIKPGVMASQGL